MQKRLVWRIVITAAVLVIFAGVGVYPILASYYSLPIPSWLAQKQLKLGLDLKGGVHLVLRVITDTALRAETEAQAERARDALSKASVTTTAVTTLDPVSFRIEGVPANPGDAVRQARTDVEATYDRSSGAGGTYTYTMKPNEQRRMRDESVVQARQTIERRVNELGVSEPSIAVQGGGDQILVQLPGVTDVDRAKSIISTTGFLKLTLVEQGPFSTREQALQTFNNAVPPDVEILPGRQEAGGTTVYYALKKAAAVTGRDLRNAQQSLDEYNRPAVHFTLKQDAAVRFGNFTQASIGRPMAIVLDDRVMSVATIQGRITDSGQITGVSREEMANIVITLKSGALPASMEYLEERTIGPSLGADSIRSGLIASVAGLLFVVIFMVAYYRRAGLNALTSILSNLIILLGTMAYIGSIMTLPGFAGFILTIGIGVDSNVLIFERIKEELDLGRPVRTAINAGFDRVWATIVDTHVASLIAAVFLFNFGTGPIRGFATTLMIGLASNVFTAVFISRTMFEAYLTRRGREAVLSI
jgi:preprotein translocase subunit SecD